MTNNPIEEVNSVFLEKLSRGHDAVLGLVYRELTLDGAVAELTLTSDHHQPYGITHGGVYCAIIESVASTSASFWLIENYGNPNIVGVNNNTDFLRAVSAGTVTARSTAIHRGRRQQLWQVDITNEQGKLVAQGRVRIQNLTDDTTT